MHALDLSLKMQPQMLVDKGSDGLHWDAGEF